MVSFIRRNTSKVSAIKERRDFAIDFIHVRFVTIVTGSEELRDSRDITPSEIIHSNKF